jgi:hypothetical protein
MENIPRGLKQEENIAEPLELGAGMQDPRKNHAGPTPNYMVENEVEREWFTQNEGEFDPRLTRSDYHDRNIKPQNNKPKKQFNKVNLCEGYIKEAKMYPEGAHITIENDDGTFFVFIEGINFIVKDTKIQVVDNIIITTHPYETYIGSGELATEESHSLSIIEINED